MKKQLLLLLTAFVLSVSVSAQKFGALKFKGAVEKNPAARLLTPKAKFAPKRAELASNQKLLGGYATDEVAEYGLGLPSYPGTLVAAIDLVASDFAMFDGGKVVAIRYAVCEDVKVSSVVLLGYNEAEGIVELASEPVTSTQVGWNTVELTTPCTLDFSKYEELIMGYEYTQTSQGYPLSLVLAGNATYSTLIYGDLGSGEGWYNIGAEAYGNLSIQAIVESDNYPAKDIIMGSIVMNSKYQKPNGTVEYALNLQNFGTETITSYTVDLDVDGQNVSSFTFPDAIGGGASATVESFFTLPATTQLGTHTLTATLKEVDGAAPAGNLSNDACSTTLFAYNSSVPRQKQLLEHHTSNTCTYCPLGISLLEKLNSTRDDIAWVCIHGNMSAVDPHNIAACDSLADMEGLTGWPTAGINRMYFEDLADYPGEILFGLGYPEAYHEQMASAISTLIDEKNAVTPSFTSVKIDQKYDADSRELTLVVSGEGGEGTAQLLANHGLSVFLTEDGLKGRQLNQGTWVSNFQHNNTLRAVLTPVVGAPINWNGNKFEKTFTISLATAWKPENMHAIAFVAPLVDINNPDLMNMEVNNCEIVAVKDAMADGIESIAPTTTPNDDAIFDLSGRQVKSPKKGLYIIGGKKQIIR